MTTVETPVLIIGGGATGAGLLRDRAQRRKHCQLVENLEIKSGD